MLFWILQPPTFLLPFHHPLPKPLPINPIRSNLPNIRRAFHSLHPLVRPLRPVRIIRVREFEVIMPPLFGKVHPVHRICQRHVVARVYHTLDEDRQGWIGKTGPAPLDVRGGAMQMGGLCGDDNEGNVFDANAFEAGVGVK